MSTKKKKKPARAARARRPKPVEVGMIRPWDDADDERPLAGHIRDLRKVMDGDARYRVESVSNYDDHGGVPAERFNEGAQTAELALVAALVRETGHKDWVVRLRIDAWRAGEPEVEDAEAAFIEARLPAVTAVRVR